MICTLDIFVLDFSMESLPLPQPNQGESFVYGNTKVINRQEVIYQLIPVQEKVLLTKWMQLFLHWYVLLNLIEKIHMPV